MAAARGYGYDSLVADFSEARAVRRPSLEFLLHQNSLRSQPQKMLQEKSLMTDDGWLLDPPLEDLVFFRVSKQMS